jgi:hypothetical protein
MYYFVIHIDDDIGNFSRYSIIATTCLFDVIIHTITVLINPLVIVH